MKIVCTKGEYAFILRKCFAVEAFDTCRGCLLEGFHDGDCPGIEKAVDIEIVPSEMGGESNV